MTQIIIELMEDKIWRKKTLTKKMMTDLISACLVKTNTVANFVFINVNYINKNIMIEYNTKYRNIKSDTNVLSFANCDKKNAFFNKKHNILYLGELLFSFERIFYEAREYNKSFDDRLKHLFVHGILHLLGFDHVVEKERLIMEEFETKILSNFGVYDIYD